MATPLLAFGLLEPSQLLVDVIALLAQRCHGEFVFLAAEPRDIAVESGEFLSDEVDEGIVSGRHCVTVESFAV